MCVCAYGQSVKRVSAGTPQGVLPTAYCCYGSTEEGAAHAPLAIDVMVLPRLMLLLLPPLLLPLQLLLLMMVLLYAVSLLSRESIARMATPALPLLTSGSAHGPVGTRQSSSSQKCCCNTSGALSFLRGPLNHRLLYSRGGRKAMSISGPEASEGKSEIQVRAYHACSGSACLHAYLHIKAEASYAKKDSL